MVPGTVKLVRHLVAHRLPTYRCLSFIRSRLYLQAYITPSYGLSKRLRIIISCNFHAFLSPLGLNLVRLPRLILAFPVSDQSSVHSFKEVHQHDFVFTDPEARPHPHRSWTLPVQLIDHWPHTNELLLSIEQKLLHLLYSLHHCYP